MEIRQVGSYSNDNVNNTKLSSCSINCVSFSSRCNCCFLWPFTALDIRFDGRNPCDWCYQSNYTWIPPTFVTPSTSDLKDSICWLTASTVTSTCLIAMTIASLSGLYCNYSYQVTYTSFRCTFFPSIIIRLPSVTPATLSGVLSCGRVLPNNMRDHVDHGNTMTTLYRQCIHKQWKGWGYITAAPPDFKGAP